MNPLTQIVEAYSGHEWKIFHPTLAVVEPVEQPGLLLGAVIEAFQERFQCAGRWDPRSRATLVSVDMLRTVAIMGYNTQSFPKVWMKVHGLVVGLDSMASDDEGLLQAAIEASVAEDDQGTWEPKIWALAS